MSKKRKAEEDADGAPAEKKHEPEVLGPGEILIKYQSEEFRAKLLDLQAFCKHPSLNPDNRESFKAGDTWAIDWKTVYLGHRDSLTVFLKVLADPFNFEVKDLAPKDVIGVGLCAIYFDVPGIQKKICDRAKELGEFIIPDKQGDAKGGLLTATAAMRLSATSRKLDNQTFALYCFVLGCCLAEFRAPNLKTPDHPGDIMDAQVMWDCMRVSRISSETSVRGESRLRFSVQEAMKILASS